jgi:hypothetical protein
MFIDSLKNFKKILKTDFLMIQIIEVIFWIFPLFEEVGSRLQGDYPYSKSYNDRYIKWNITIILKTLKLATFSEPANNPILTAAVRKVA